MINYQRIYNSMYILFKCAPTEEEKKKQKSNFKSMKYRKDLK